jgi:multiple sugar transport system substrate-binding protein
LLVVGSILAACGSGSGSGTPTLNFYIYPENSGALQDAVNNCNAQANGAYKI